MRTKVLLVLCMMLWLAPPGTASTTPADWTVSSHGNRVWTVTLNRAVTVDLDHAENQIETGRRSVESVVAIDGEFAGLVIRDTRGVVRVGMARHRAFRGGLLLWGTYDDEYRQILEPGRYTVTTFTDRNMTVHLPVLGGGSQRFTHGAVASVSVTHQAATDLASTTGPLTDMAAPMHLSARSTFMVFGLSTAPLPMATFDALCVTATSNPACVQAQRANVGPSGVVGQQTSQGSAVFSEFPGELPSGSYQASYIKVHTPMAAHYLLTVTMP